MNEKWWLITWSTFGTWLPGDPRGFQTWRGRKHVPPPKKYAKENEPTYKSKNYEGLHAVSERNSGDAVELSMPHQKLALKAIVNDLKNVPLNPAIIAVGSTHVHFLAHFGELRIRRTIGRLKASATRELHESGNSNERIWSRNCHMKSKDNNREFETAFNYIARHREESALVHIWQRPGSLTDDKSSA